MQLVRNQGGGEQALCMSLLRHSRHHMSDFMVACVRGVVSECVVGDDEISLLA